MGGKKKLGIKQMEKQQSTQDDSKAAGDKKKEKAGPPKERKTVGIMPPDTKDGKIIAEVKKMGALTPYSIATRYGVRISAAKEFLKELETNGTLELVSGSHNIKIYKPKAS
jgi:small subunit ribosomal protein S25e